MLFTWHVVLVPLVMALLRLPLAQSRSFGVLAYSATCCFDWGVRSIVVGCSFLLLSVK